MPLLRTIRFFKMLLTPTLQTATVETTQITINPHITLVMDIYSHIGNYNGTILFIHGMNKHGKDDSRIQHFCQCLAAIGYRIIVPTYPTISQHIFVLTSINEMQDTIVAVTNNENLCPKKKVAIFTVSLSGALALSAATQKNTYQHVSAFFTIGSGFYVDNVFKIGLEKPEQDYYMKLICIKNVLYDDPTIDREIIAMLDIAINDAFSPNNKPKLPESLIVATPATQEFIHKLIGEHANPAFLYATYKNYLLQKQAKLLNYSNSELIKFPVILLHSKNDQVIPATETLRYSDELISKKVKHKIFVTSLLEHVNHNIAIKKLLELFKLLYLFNWFFKSI